MEGLILLSGAIILLLGMCLGIRYEMLKAEKRILQLQQRLKDKDQEEEVINRYKDQDNKFLSYKKVKMK